MLAQHTGTSRVCTGAADLRDPLRSASVAEDCSHQLLATATNMACLIVHMGILQTQLSQLAHAVALQCGGHVERAAFLASPRTQHPGE